MLAADPLAAVRAAADITGRTGSVQSVSSLQTASDTKKQILRGSAVYDYTTRLGRVQVTVPPGGATKGELVEVVSPGVVYMQNSGAKVPAGKWVKVDVQQLADGNLVSSGATDPATAANALRGAATAVLLGSKTVDGVLLKHYKGTLDLAKAASATGGGASAGLALAGHTFTVKQIPYEVWLDQHGRIQRIVETFTFSKVAGSTAKKDQVVVTSSNVFSGYGTPVTVALPPAADVYGAQPSK
ncbi:SCO4651 family lipoprotein [Streptacidiphilus sp. PAMC 29251]